MKSVDGTVGFGVMALAGALAVVAACAANDAQEVGERCEHSDECAPGLECVEFDEHGPACLPAPTTRTPKDRACTLDAHCNLGTTNLWPVEARCDRDRGACVCDPDARDCGPGKTFTSDCLCAVDDAP